jgi:hypothetical protein
VVRHSEDHHGKEVKEAVNQVGGNGILEKVGTEKVLGTKEHASIVVRLVIKGGSART